MYVAAQKATFEGLRSVAAGSVTASYTALGSALSNPAVLLVFTSTLDSDVLISLDGSTDQVYIPTPPSGESVTISFELGANKEGTSKLQLPKGTQVSLKRGAGGASSSGSIYLMVMYGRE